MSDIMIQSFGLGQEVLETSSEILGGKGAGLVYMSSQGIPVPPGFILPTTLWAQHKKAPITTMKLIAKEIAPWLVALEKHFGYMPLLSVRSGARVSCPGMMDTILNVGLDGNTLYDWTKRLGDECCTDSQHRLITMYGSVVHEIPRQELEAGSVADAYTCYTHHTKQAFPGFKEQLLGSISAVFSSWNNDRAKYYRKMNSIPDEWGTACVIQAMVFGNMNDQSGTGVLFTRNPDTGTKDILGEFLINAQGEDVVAGIKTPMKLQAMMDWNSGVLTELQTTVMKLESLKKDVQDIEFTIQDGKLYILQTRNAKRSAIAAIKIALDMLKEGMLTPGEVCNRVSGRDLDLAQRPVIDPNFKVAPFSTGIPACSGVVTGHMVFSSKDAVNCKVPCILVSQETTPDDIAGMDAAVGVLTLTGGATSHAAVVARGMNKPCVVGIGGHIDTYKGHDGGIISIDGATGRVWFEKVPTVACDPKLISAFKEVMMYHLQALPILHTAPSPSDPTLDSAYVILGERMLNPHSCVEFLISISKKVARIYVDFVSLTESQQSFITQLGGVDIPAVVKELEDHKELMGELVLVGPSSPSFESVGVADDLESMIMAEGEVILTDKTSPAVKKVLQWRKEEGLSPISLGAVVPGSKSFITFEQALQIG